MTTPKDPLQDLDSPEADKVDLDELISLDSVFAEPIGPAAPTPTPKRTPATAGVVPMLGLSRQEERAGAAATGAVVAPIIKKTAEWALPSTEARTAEGVKRLQEQRRLEQLMQNLRDEELLRLGIKPEAAAAESATSGTKWLRNWAGMDKTIEGGVPEASAAYQRSKGQGKITGKMTKRFGPLKPGQSLVDKLLEQSASGEAAAAARAEAEATATAAAKAKLAAATPGPLSRAAQILKSPVVAGAGAGLSFYDAYRRFLDGDRTGAVIAALGGTAGIAALFGGGLPAIGLGLATIPAGMAYDWYKEREANAPAPASTQPQMPEPVPVGGSPLSTNQR